MRTRLMTWAAAVVLTALLTADADACGRGRRGRGGGGGCGGAAGYGGAVYGGGYGGMALGCDTAAGGYGGYGFAGGAPAWGAPAWEGPTFLPAPAGPPGGASAAIAADRARRGNAVYALDPATGVLRQVGWLNADGTLRGLNGTGPAPPK